VPGWALESAFVISSGEISISQFISKAMDYINNINAISSKTGIYI
jgi:hypothetical protein